MGMQPLLSTAASTHLQAYLWLQLPTSNLPDKSDILAIAAGVELAAFRQVREERAELVLFIVLIPKVWWAREAEATATAKAEQ